MNHRNFDRYANQIKQ